MAHRPLTQAEADRINKEGTDVQMRKAIAYLNTHNIAPNGNVIVTKEGSNCCLGEACDCFRNPNASRGVKERVKQGRLNTPLSRLELSKKERAMIMNAPVESGLYLDALPMV